MKIPDLVALTCKEVTELVTDYTSGELGAEDRARFEQHLHACTWCMTYLNQMRRTSDWMRQLAAPTAPSTRDALTEMYRNWKREKP
jgi:anti-sigma factor RsiW